MLDGLLLTGHVDSGFGQQSSRLSLMEEITAAGFPTISAGAGLCAGTQFIFQISRWTGLDSLPRALCTWAGMWVAPRGSGAAIGVGFRWFTELWAADSSGRSNFVGRGALLTIRAGSLAIHLALEFPCE